MSGSPVILALDTTAAACSVALWRDNAPGAHRFERMRRGQSERLLPMVAEVMAEAGLGYESLGAVAVTQGPGAFTGVRIGLAAARGLALAQGVPLIGISSFAAAAAATAPEERAGRVLVVVLDAKRADVYAQVFDAALAPVIEPLAVRPEDLSQRLPPGPLALAGDGASIALEPLRAAGRDVALSRATGPVDAVHVARLAADRPLPDPQAPPPRPIYLRAPDVTLPDGAPGRGPGS